MRMTCVLSVSGVSSEDEMCVKCKRVEQGEW